MMNRKLTVKMVRGIKVDISTGKTLASIANSYGVGRSTISDIKCGITWVEVV